ncbi:MAG: hypothetical protein C5B52_15990 [Bacteroidetes bacterium]|nr:MAG: hypothetical protein C5B52_15990 [Bacteroidota bacterium]
MKKIYLPKFLLSLTLILTSWNLLAQCPGPSPSVATPLRDGGVCRVIVQATQPNVHVVAMNANGELLGQATSDASGNACVYYSCDQTPSAVVGCGDNGCCFASLAAAVTLPVKLVTFTAKLEGVDVDLQWSTAFEIDNYKYVVEKSYDGKSFASVSEIRGSTYSLRQLDYTYTDRASINNQSAYYRLKQIDIDGKIEYSKVVYVNNRQSGGKVSSVFPNPFHSDIQLVGINSSDLNSKNVRVFSSTGKQVNFTISGANEIRLDQTAPSGIYIIKISDQIFKVVKN